MCAVMAGVFDNFLVLFLSANRLPRETGRTPLVT